MYRRRGFKKRNYSKTYNVGTRYYSTRKVPGLIRTPSRYILTGRARRGFNKQRLGRALSQMAERKFFDFDKTYSAANVTPNAVTQAGILQCLSLVPQGQSENTRVGDKCLGTSLEFKLKWNYPSTAIDFQLQLTFRFIIFIWKDDTDPTTADLLDISGTSQAPLAMLDHDRKVKRKLLFDKTFVSSAYKTVADDVLTTESAIKYFNCYIPLGRIKGGLNKVNFYGGTTDGVNKIWLLMVSNVANAINGWDTWINSRYNYTDM